MGRPNTNHPKRLFCKLFSKIIVQELGQPRRYLPFKTSRPIYVKIFYTNGPTVTDLLAAFIRLRQPWQQFRSSRGPYRRVYQRFQLFRIFWFAPRLSDYRWHTSPSL